MTGVEEKAIRESLGYKRLQWAKALHVTRQTISLWENGTCGIRPSVEAAIRKIQHDAMKERTVALLEQLSCAFGVKGSFEAMEDGSLLISVVVSPRELVALKGQEVAI